MQIITHSQAALHNNSERCLIKAYPTNASAIDGAIAEISGRYPENGFVLNEISHELAFVVKGQGALITKDGAHPLQEGDVALLSPGEPFAWDGLLTLFIACSPAFDPTQYKSVATEGIS